MSEQEGWFHGLSPADLDRAVAGINEGSADAPHPWPDLAVEGGWVPDRETYYERLHAATIAAARSAAQARETAEDRQLIGAVRTMDDLERVRNELAERVTEWAATRYGEEYRGMEGVRSIQAIDPETHLDRRLHAVANRTADLDGEAEAIRAAIEQHAPAVAPNLAMLAGPILAARLIALAGGLESLAKLPSGTVQVLGAEDALFAHLRGEAPSPKHGIIVTHPAIKSMPAGQRGSAARALAGKLAIAARIDHYAGDRRPELEADLAARLERIRGDGGSG